MVKLDNLEKDGEAAEGKKAEKEVEEAVKEVEENVPGLKGKLTWGLAVAGAAGAIAAFFFRNQIVDGVTHLLGKRTEKDRQEEVLAGMAKEAPDEFLEKPPQNGSPEEVALLPGINADDLSVEAIIKDRSVGWKPPVKDDFLPKEEDDPLSTENIIKDRSVGWKKEPDEQELLLAPSKSGQKKTNIFTEFDSISMPSDADEDLLRQSMSDEAFKESNRRKK